MSLLLVQVFGARSHSVCVRAVLGLLTLGVPFAGLWAQPLLPSVDPGGNEERFEPVVVRYLRMSIERTNGGEPALDEVEVFGPTEHLRNLALQNEGTLTSASGEFSGPASVEHRVAMVNDGDYGNESSWVADTLKARIQFEFPTLQEISRIVWSRDRRGLETTRTPTIYVFEVSQDGVTWEVISSGRAREAFKEPRAGERMQYPEIPVRDTVADWSIDSLYVIDEWHAIDGVPSESIAAIEQTPDGYLWLGGEFGLARFDGGRFQLFQPQYDFEGSLGAIVDLLVTSAGQLWLSSSSGHVGTIQGDRFFGKEWAGGVIEQMAEGNDGSVWGVSGSGLSSMREDSSIVSVVDGGEAAQIVTVSREGGVFYGRYGTIRERVRGGATVLMESGAGRFYSGAALGVRSSGGVWIYDVEGQLRHSLPNGLVTVPLALPIKIAPEKEYDLLEDRTGNIWIAANAEGVYRLALDGQIELFPLTGDIPGSGGALTLFEDQVGAIWVGGRDRGLFRFRRREFELVRLGPSPTSVISVCSGDGNSVLALDRRGDAFRIEHHSAIRLELPPSRLLVSDADDGRFWISPRVWERESIQVWERSAGDHLHKLAEWPATREWITAATGSGSDDVVFGLNGNLGIYNNGRFDLALETPVRELGRIRWIVPGGAKHYWLVSENGRLWEYRDQGISEIAVPSEIGNVPIGSLFSEEGNTLWVGTLGRGLWRMDEKGWVSMNQLLGFPAKFVRALLGDGSGNLWVAGQGGFYRINLGTLHIDPEESGLVLGWAYWGSDIGGADAQVTLEGYPNAWQARDGKLYFASNLGVAVLDPASLSSRDQAPTIAIEKLSLNGERINFRLEHELEVTANSDLLELEFAAPNIASPESTRVQYRLLGRDESWIDLGVKREIRITSLLAGRYEIQLRAAAGLSSWRSYPGKLSVRALAPFWNARRFGFVFFGGAILFAGLGAGFLFLRSLQTKLLLAENLQSVDQERARIAADMHDRLGSRLTHLGLMARELDEHTNEELCARVRQSVYESARSLDEIVWAIDPSKDTVESLIAYCMNLVDEFRESSSVRWHIETPEKTDGIPVRASIRHELFLALSEALNNVVKHSEARKAWLRICLDSSGLVLEVEDDGRGFDGTLNKDSISKGNGLKNLRSRMARIGGKCDVDSELGRGTILRFVVSGVTGTVSRSSSP